MKRKKKPYEENYSLIRHLQSRVYKLESKVMYEPVEDVCKWDEVSYKEFRVCNRRIYIVSDATNIDSVKYCPYCGKEIKIKE